MISVVSVHSGLTLALATNLNASAENSPNFWDFVQLNVQAISVPTFVLISCILFSSKPFTWQRFSSRQLNLFYLYLFWVGTWMYYTKPEFVLDFRILSELFLRGGGWQFYFLAVIILMTCVNALLLSSKKAVKVLTFTACVGIFLYFEIDTIATRSWAESPNYWNPCCFLLLPCFAVLVNQYKERVLHTHSVTIIIALILLAVAVAIVEWQFAIPGEFLPSERRWLPRHARLSVHLTALVVVICAMKCKPKPRLIISFLARNSLGVYCLHGFILGGVLTFFQSLMGSYNRELAIATGCASVVILCVIASEVLRKILQHKII